MHLNLFVFASPLLTVCVSLPLGVIGDCFDASTSGFIKASSQFFELGVYLTLDLVFNDLGPELTLNPKC